MKPEPWKCFFFILVTLGFSVAALFLLASMVRLLWMAWAGVLW